MSTVRRHVPTSALRLLAAAAASCGTVLLPAAAAEQAARLTISVELQRQGRSQLGADVGQMRLNQRAEITINLVSDGTPMPNNPLDPADPARRLAQAQRVQQRMQAAQARVAARTPGAAATPAMDMQALQAMAQRMQAMCGTDRDCLMREAGAFSRARVQAGGTADAPEDEDVPTPYLLFRALDNCQPGGTLFIDERIEGSFADVQGQVAYTETRQADDRGTPATQPCGTQMAVLDTRNGRLWVGQPLLGLRAHGLAVRSERGRSPQRHEGAQELRWHEATAWIAERMTNLNRQGSAEASLPAGADGKTQVRLSWRWQPT
jgi:hypothetical protein